MNQPIDPAAIANACLCLTVRKAARAVTRRYDDAFRPLSITSGQFSILVAASAPNPLGMVRLAETLGMDRTTLTAAVKPLERDGLLTSGVDPEDGRARRYVLTDHGRRVLEEALPLWTAAQAALAGHAAPADVDRLRREIRSLA